MECNVTKQAVSVNDIVYDGAVEQSLECDIVLPDYCPDIVKILKCELSCAVTSAQPEGPVLQLEGLAVAKVLYLSDDNPSGTMELHSADCRIPYSRSCDWKGKQPVERALVQACVRTDTVSCRAVSKRRLEVRGAVTHRIKAVSCAEQEVVTDAQGAGVQLRRSTLERTACVCQQRGELEVQETLELSSGKPPVRSIVLSRCTAVVTDSRVLAGRVMTKGELRLQLLYYGVGEDNGDAQCGPGPLETMEYTLPISQIIDLPGADDQSLCSLCSRVTQWDLQPRADGEGQMTLLDLTATVHTAAEAYTPQTVLLAQDCYGTCCECSCEAQTLGLLDLMRVVQDTEMVRETVDLPDEVRTILAGWASVLDQEVRRDGDALLVEYRLDLCLLAADAEGNIQFYSDARPQSFRLPLGRSANTGTQEEQPFLLPSLTPLSLSYSVKGPSAEIRCEVQVCGSLCRMLSRSAITQVSCDPGRPCPRDSDCALTIYYADRGETLWDIAKRYRSSLEAVLEENYSAEEPAPESGELPARRMLIIPR